MEDFTWYDYQKILEVHALRKKSCPVGEYLYYTYTHVCTFYSSSNSWTTIWFYILTSFFAINKVYYLLFFHNHLFIHSHLFIIFLLCVWCTCICGCLLHLFGSCMCRYVCILILGVFTSCSLLYILRHISYLSINRAHWFG